MHPGVNEAQGWMFTDAKYFPSEKTAMYYLGLGGGSLTGGRFLAPGADENKGTYYDQLAHTSYEDVDAVFEALKTNESINVVYNADGDIEYVDVLAVPYYYDAANEYKKFTTVLRLESTGLRKSDDNIIEDVVAFLAEGKAWAGNGNYYDVKYYEKQTAVAPNQKGNFTVNYVNSSNVTIPTAVGNGDIILVSQNRRGEYSVEGFTHVAYKTGYAATGSDLAIADVAKNKEYFVMNGGNIDSAPFGKQHIVRMDKENASYYGGAFDKQYGIVSGTTLANGNAIALDAIYLSTSNHDELVPTFCDGVYSVITAKDVKKLNTITGKLESVTSLNAVDLEAGLYYYGEFNLDSDVNATGLYECNFDYVTTDANGNAIDGFYTDRNGAYFHLSNQVTGYLDDAWLEASVTAKLRDKDVLTTPNTNATMPNLTTDYNAVTALGVSNKISVVDITDVDGITFDANGNVTSWGYVDYNDETAEYEWDIDGYPTRLTTLTRSGVSCYENIQDAVFNVETLTFDYSDQVLPLTVNGTALDGSSVGYAFGKVVAGSPDVTLFDNAAAKHVSGIYYLETPDNDSDYYVIYTGPTSELNLEYSVNTRTETVTAVAADGKTELTAKAVKLDGVWYPAFETEEELTDFVVAISGIEALEGNAKDVTSDFYEWYKSAQMDTLNPLMGSKVYGQVLPTDSISDVAHAKECEYVATSTADKVKVTSNLDTIDVNEAGVYDLVWTAELNGEKLEETHTVKVVVAPNYTRTWENGRVKTLTSYYVTDKNAKYAEYNYDWAAGTATVTYFNLDGSVNDVQTVNL